MFRRARELGPPVLVPLAWAFVTAAHLEVVTEHTLFVTHVVMAVLLVGFAVTGYADMREGRLEPRNFFETGLPLTVAAKPLSRSRTSELPAAVTDNNLILD